MSWSINWRLDNHPNKNRQKMSYFTKEIDQKQSILNTFINYEILPYL